MLRDCLKVKMNLLDDIPEEVIEGHILPKLNWDDLLRFRRVSKYACLLTNSYLDNHPDKTPEVEINETDRTMGVFLNTGFLSTKIFLNITSERAEEFYEKEDAAIPEILETQGPAVQHLRLSKMSSSIFGKERLFLDGLPNLVSLQVDQKVGVIDPPEKLPSVIKNLKKLKIGQDHAFPGHQIRENRHLLQVCSNLEYIALPFAEDLPIPEDDADEPHLWGPQRLLLEQAFTSLHQTLQECRRNISKQQDIKPLYFDFEHFYHPHAVPLTYGLSDRAGSLPFLQLCQFSNRNHIRLENVDSSWCQGYNLEDGCVPEMGLPIVSLINLDPAVFELDLSNLEELDIRATSRTALGWQSFQPRWPKLKILKLAVNSRTLRPFAMETNIPGLIFMQALSSRVLFISLFDNVQYWRLTELRLKFYASVFWECDFPFATYICRACPNLKNLSICQWPGFGREMSRFWGGLPAMEELTLCSCENLGHLGFIGLNSKKPAFLQLKRLKKLSLLGLHKMPKISDTLFVVLFRNMELRQLILNSDDPMERVTINGIRSPLTGKFAGSIEKFPFKGWSLQNCSKGKLADLETRFRSYNMI